MRGTQTEERKLRTHANNVDKPEAAYCKALSDLRVFTCVQRETCRADLDRLKSRVTAVLVNSTNSSEHVANDSAFGKHKSLLDSSSDAVHKYCPVARPQGTRIPGQYPAIDRLLARKQAISRLHDLKDNDGSAAIIPWSKSKDKFLSTPNQQCDPATKPGLQPTGPQQKCIVRGCMFSDPKALVVQADSRTAQHSIAQYSTACLDRDQCKGAAASDLAHDQYLSFKTWRQQRHTAAVTVQRHIRGLLARRLSMQMRYLNKHRELLQRRVLSSCLQSWQSSARSQSRFRARVRQRNLRFGLWQHCHLQKQYDGQTVFSCEGKTVMAAKYRQWRIKAVIFTRWQLQTVRHNSPPGPQETRKCTSCVSH